MKTSLKYLFIVPSFVFIVIWFVPKTQTYPQPTEMVKEDEQNDGDFERKRQEWMESMHTCDKNTDWRLMDLQSRAERNNKEKNFQSDFFGTWFERGSKNIAGRMIYCDYDTTTQLLYGTSSGGNIWKGRINENDWQSVNDARKISDIYCMRIIPTNNGKRICVATGTRILFSDDDGGTWNESSGIKVIQNAGNIKRMIYTNSLVPAIYLLAAEWDNTQWLITVYKSTDKATSFSKILSYQVSLFGNQEKFDIWTDKYGTGLVYMVENTHFYKIENNNTLSKIGDIPITNTGSLYLSGNQSTGNSIYLLVGQTNNISDIYSSSNNGINWMYKGNVNERPFANYSFTCSCVNPEYLYLGGVNCHKSIDGGVTWTTVNDWSQYYGNTSSYLHADIPSINSFKTNNNTEMIFINTDGGTYVSYNSLKTVQNISLSNLQNCQYYSVFTSRNNTNIIYAGSQDQGLQKTTEASIDGALAFNQMISGDYGIITSSDKGKSIWSVYPAFAIYFPSPETSSQSVFTNFPCHGQQWLPPIMADPTISNTAYLGGGGINGGTHILKMTSTKSGTINYTEQSSDFSEGASCTISAMAYSTINTNYRYLLTNNGKFFYSTDAGQNWIKTQSFTDPSSIYFYGASILPSKIQLGKVYIAGSGYQTGISPVYVSIDNGQSFKDMSLGLPKTLVHTIDATPNDSQLFAATEVGPYIFNQKSNYWYSLTQGQAPDQPYECVEYIPEISTARFATYGRGIWDFKMKTTTVGILDHEAEQLKIYPNPANNTLFIEGLSKNANTKIYDLAGVLKINKRISGNQIDVSNLSSGVYIIAVFDKSKMKIKEFIKQ